MRDDVLLAVPVDILRISGLFVIALRQIALPVGIGLTVVGDEQGPLVTALEPVDQIGPGPQAVPGSGILRAVDLLVVGEILKHRTAGDERRGIPRGRVGPVAGQREDDLVRTQVVVGIEELRVVAFQRVTLLHHLVAGGDALRPVGLAGVDLAVEVEACQQRPGGTAVGVSVVGRGQLVGKRPQLTGQVVEHLPAVVDRRDVGAHGVLLRDERHLRVEVQRVGVGPGAQEPRLVAAGDDPGAVGFGVAGDPVVRGVADQLVAHGHDVVDVVVHGRDPGVARAPREIVDVGQALAGQPHVVEGVGRAVLEHPQHAQVVLAAGLRRDAADALDHRGVDAREDRLIVVGARVDVLRGGVRMRILVQVAHARDGAGQQQGGKSYGMKDSFHGFHRFRR